MLAHRTAQVIELPAPRRRAPTTENGKVRKYAPPKRVSNAERRSREHLTPAEVEALCKAATSLGRHGHRDATLVMAMYRHGLRISKAESLRCDVIDLAQGTMHVAQAKNGTPSTHPLRGPELRALRRPRREYAASPYVFVTERGGPMTASTVRKMLARAGTVAGLASLNVHAHMLRHAAGYKLANDGQDTRALQHSLGHRNIQHTVRYTELAADRFKGFWKD